MKRILPALPLALLVWSLPLSAAEKEGMVLVPATTTRVGTTADERAALAPRFQCDPSWFNDDLAAHEVKLPAFWIDRSPVTNAQYLRFALATNARPPWPGGRIPEGHENHPVVNVTWYDAQAYARWAGKRLATAEEWEVACRGEKPGLYPWGDNWPGPADVQPVTQVDWNDHKSAPVGGGTRGRSRWGMEDFVQQVCEWTATSLPHHGTSFVKVKGTSWLHRDPIHFRAAATTSAMGGFTSPLIGFRCALDGDRQPAALPAVPATAAKPAPAPLVPASIAGDRIAVFPMGAIPATLRANVADWNQRFLGGTPDEALPGSRGFLIVFPPLGPWPVGLFLAEARKWDGEDIIPGWYDKHPPLQREATADGRLRYRQDFAKLDFTYEFVPGTDCLELVSTITNKTGRAGRFHSSSCFNLTNHPAFYDADHRRTYYWSQNDGFQLFRTLPRTGECVRWIQAPDMSAHGGFGNPSMMAVTSRDGAWVLASVRSEPDGHTFATGNGWLNCMHTEAEIDIAAHSTRTTRQRLYFLKGGLDELLARVKKDLAAQGR